MAGADATARFPAEDPSAAAARRFVASQLTNWGLTELCDPALALVTELVSNAVLHAGTDFDVVVRRGDGRLRVEVHDGSPLLPVRKRYSVTAATGRGLVLVEEMADAWGAEPTATGKAVWFELDDGAGAKSRLSREAQVPELDVDELLAAYGDLDDDPPPPGANARRRRGVADLPGLVATL